MMALPSFFAAVTLKKKVYLVFVSQIHYTAKLTKTCLVKLHLSDLSDWLTLVHVYHFVLHWLSVVPFLPWVVDPLNFVCLAACLFFTVFCLSVFSLAQPSFSLFENLGQCSRCSWDYIIFFQALKKPFKNSFVQLTPGKVLKCYKQSIDEVNWVDSCIIQFEYFVHQPHARDSHGVPKCDIITLQMFPFEP